MSRGQDMPMKMMHFPSCPYFLLEGVAPGKKIPGIFCALSLLLLFQVILFLKKHRNIRFWQDMARGQV